MEPEFLAEMSALTRAETRVRNAFRAGLEADLRTDGESGADGQTPALRAAMIAEILLGEPGPGRNARLVLRGARITGQLDLSYARIEHPIIFRECDFDEPIVLTEARLGTLNLDRCSFPGIEGSNLELDGDLGLAHVSSARTLKLMGARLRRDVRLEGACLRHRPDESAALDADHVIVEGSVDCHGFEAAGTVSMAGARINGTMRLEGGKIVGSRKNTAAFIGDGMTVGHDLNGQQMTVEGEVRLVDVSVASTLEFRGAKLVNPDGVALRLDRTEIASSLYCDHGFTAIGEVRAIGAHVRGSVYFNNAEIGRAVPAAGAGSPHAPGVALRLVRTKIDGDLGCWTEFAAHGSVELARSSVSGESRIDTTGLEGYPTAADLTAGRFSTLALTGRPPGGRLDLTKAKAEFFKDDPEHWRSENTIVDEFEYTSIQMVPVTPKQREQWLRRALTASRRKPGGDHDGYLPQPYDQLAGAYRRAGDDHAARIIQLAKYRQRNRVMTWRRWWSKLWNVVQDGMIGYGYAPLRALIWLVALFALGTLLFRYGAQPRPLANMHRGFGLSDSVSYTLDLLLPTSGLQERQIWRSSGGFGEVAAAALVVFGWTLGATVFAAAARVLQRN